MSVEERAKTYEAKCAEMFALWLSDTAAFRAQYPEVRISLHVPSVFARPFGENYEVGALDSIASHLLEGSGFDYEIVELVGMPPQCFITRYNARTSGAQ